MTRAGWVVAGAVLALGVLAEVVVGDAQPLRVAVGDLAAGVALGGAGSLALGRASSTWTGRWLALAAVLWYLATLSADGDPTLSGLGDAVGLAYRGALVTAVLCACCRTRSPFVLAVAAAGWIDGVLIGSDSWPSFGLAALVLVTAILVPRDRPRAFLPAACLAVALAGPAAAVELGQVTDTGNRVLLGADLAIVVTALAAVRTRQRPADRILELAHQWDLEDALGHALGDPRVRLLEPAAGGTPPAGRERTVVTGVAVIEHAAGALAEPELHDGVEVAIVLQREHDRRRAELSAAVDEVRRSQRRMLLAADESRARLQRRLEDGAIPRALAIRDRLAGDPATADAAAAIGRAIDELRSLVIGLHPPALGPAGLAGAIAELARTVSLPVTVRVDDRRHPADLELVVYFACAEAITNAIKHASATRVDIEVTCDDHRVVAEVVDDGVGGASLTPTSAIIVRAAAVNGRVTVNSAAGVGTTVRVEVPR